MRISEPDTIVLSVAQMRRAEQMAMDAGDSGVALMERAGAAVAAVVRGLIVPPARVAVVCGPGDNGGDGFVVARLLADEGFKVDVGVVGGRLRVSKSSEHVAGLWKGPVVDAADLDFAQADVIVDAIFGIGLNRDVEGASRGLIERINGSGRTVVSVDIPSGIAGDTGRIFGAAVAATETVTFLRPKPAHLLFPGRGLCGRVTVADICIGDEVVSAVAANTFRNMPGVWRRCFPQAGVTGHKYDRGHAVIFAGGIEGTGAARLAARASLRVGAGLVTLAVPEAALLAHAGRAPDALMVRATDLQAADCRVLDDLRHNAIVIGPAFGVGVATREAVQRICAAGRRLVLDADALSSFAGAREDLGKMIADGGVSAVLTPHEGEFRRLFPDIPAEIGKLARARQASTLMGAVVLLKGADTVVAAPDGRAVINDCGNPDLATAGSGDVLAGLVGGLLAQGMPAFEAAAAAVWLHAQAAEALGAGLIADDLPEGILGPLRSLRRQVL